MCPLVPIQLTSDTAVLMFRLGVCAIVPIHTANQCITVMGFFLSPHQEPEEEVEKSSPVASSGGEEAAASASEKSGGEESEAGSA